MNLVLCSIFVAVKQTWSERQFVRAQDNEGNSALHFAVMNGKYEVDMSAYTKETTLNYNLVSEIKVKVI